MMKIFAQSRIKEFEGPTYYEYGSMTDEKRMLHKTKKLKTLEQTISFQIAITEF